MPLPSRKKGEERKAFVSRCISDLTRKGEGKDTAQRVAICNSRANNSLTDEEMETMASLWFDCEECLDEDLGFTEVFALAAEDKKPDKPLNKPFRTPKGPKKFSVYVKNDKGNIVKVNFGDPNMEIKRDDPARRKNFRARHNCDSPGPKWKARYWSCKMWEKGKPVSKVAGAKVVFTSYVNGHMHKVPCDVMAGETGETSYDYGHTHQYSVDKNGEITISESAGHIHKVDYDD